MPGEGPTGVRSALLVALLVAAAIVPLVGGAPAGAGAGAAGRPMVQVEVGPQLPPVDPGTARAGDEARRILAGDDYRGRGSGRSLADRIRQWIRDHLPKFNSPRGRGVSNDLSIVIVAAVVLGSLVLIGLGVARSRRGRRTPSDEEEGEVEVTPLLSVDEWAREAERLEALGSWREALRARYRALTGALIQRRLLGDQPGRTPGEHRVELSERAPPAAPAFDAVTGIFESTWFGRVRIDGGDVGRFRDLASDVLERARTTASARPAENDARPSDEP